jgi:hypothetical protein
MRSIQLVSTEDTTSYTWNQEPGVNHWPTMSTSSAPLHIYNSSAALLHLSPLHHCTFAPLLLPPHLYTSPVHTPSLHLCTYLCTSAPLHLPLHLFTSAPAPAPLHLHLLEFLAPTSCTCTLTCTCTCTCWCTCCTCTSAHC